MSSPEKNYITPRGLKKLQAELESLISVERPKVVETVAWAAGNGDRSENGDYIYGKKRLREIDRRMRFLTKRIEAAMVINPAEQSGSKVVFGATVTIRNEDDEPAVYMIVGEDETDIKNYQISWKSPLAKSILGKSVGDEVLLKKPSSEEWIRIEKIEFKAL